MEYAKLQGTFIRSAAFKDADMAARGAWATLIAYCADQENGGTIVACKDWSERQWLSRADCMRADVDHVVRSELARWAGHDLVLDGYDRVAEGAFHSLSEVNRRRALDAHERRRAAEAAAAAAAAAGRAPGTDDRDRRHAAAVPPAERPAGRQAAAGTDPGCQQPTDRPNQPPKEGPAGAAPPPKGAAASGSRGDTRRDAAPPRDEVGERIGRFRRSLALQTAIAQGDGLSRLAFADEAIRAAHTRLSDPELSARPSAADLDTVAQWWALAREASTP